MESVVKFVVVRGLKNSPQYNEMRGKIYGSLNSERLQVHLMGMANKVIAVRLINLCFVDEKWVAMTKSGMFDQEGMLIHFKAPMVDVALPDFDLAFRKASSPPNMHEVLAWWGGEVYNFMREQLSQSLVTMRKNRWLLNCFYEGFWLGICICDGSKNDQHIPLPNEWFPCLGSWWPCLIAVSPVDANGNLSVYCQAQALMRARPWLTHPSRCVIFHESPQVMPSGLETAIAETTVIIEEIEEDSADSEYEMVNPLWVDL